MYPVPNQKIEKFFNIIANSKGFAYDVETNGLDWKRGFVCGYSVSDGGESVYIPVRHGGTQNPEHGNIEYVPQFESHLAKVMKDYPYKVIGHHLKFDAHFSENHGIIISDKMADTMTRAALCDENKRSYSLAACCREFPDIPQKKGQELYEHIGREIGCKPDYTSMGSYYLLRGDDPLAVEYAEFDTRATKGLYDKQEMKIYGENLDVVEDMENHLTYVLQKMERRGIKVDLEQFGIIKKRIEDLHLDAYAKIPLKDNMDPINVKSGKDLREYFEMCEIDDWPMTAPSTKFPEGQPSFNKSYLSSHEEGFTILEARKYDHLVNSFITPFMQYVFNGRIHTTFNQSRNEFDFGARPGRLSCNDPNLQQVPKRDVALGSLYRSVFVADDEYIFVEYDHSQAEPRLYAHYSGEPVLLEGYNKTPFIDMHTIAAQMMNIDRKFAKNMNLGILYTMGAAKLAAQLGISIDQARAIIYRWYKTFGKVRSFTKAAQAVAENRKYVFTILGRRARFPDPRWAYRAANRIIQGSSADILKWKMVQLDRWITKNNYQDVVHLLLNIHDAILVQIHKSAKHLIPEIATIFASVQEPPFNLRVPFHSDYHEGSNWSEASYGTLN
jgi:DNA polymerase I